MECIFSGDLLANLIVLFYLVFWGLVLSMSVMLDVLFVIVCGFVWDLFDCSLAICVVVMLLWACGDLLRFGCVFVKLY